MLPSAAIPSIRLLIADRQAATRDALMGLLRGKAGVEFIGAVSPEHAVWQAALRQVNLVLLDVIKPHAASARLCQELCTLSPRPAVIALTTFADLDEEQALREAGAAGYLLKKVHPEKLMNAIRLIVARERPAPDG